MHALRAEPWSRNSTPSPRSQMILGGAQTGQTTKTWRPWVDPRVRLTANPGRCRARPRAPCTSPLGQGGLRLCLLQLLLGPHQDLPPCSLFYKHWVCPAWGWGREKPCLPPPSNLHSVCGRGAGRCERQVQPDLESGCSGLSVPPSRVRR